MRPRRSRRKATSSSRPPAWLQQAVGGCRSLSPHLLGASLQACRYHEAVEKYNDAIELSSEAPARRTMTRIQIQTRSRVGGS